MIEAIFRILPDWMLSIIVAVFLWYGVNYAFLADAFWRWGENYSFAEYQQSYEYRAFTSQQQERALNCRKDFGSRIVARHRAEVALWTATILLITPTNVRIDVNERSRFMWECVQ